MFKTVLFPIDQSREAREAAEVVANVVQKYGSRLVCCQCWKKLWTQKSRLVQR